MPPPRIDGDIFENRTQKVIGRVKGYNPKSHYGKEVLIFGNEDYKEAGSLDADWVVRPDSAIVLVQS